MLPHHRVGCLLRLDEISGPIRAGYTSDELSHLQRHGWGETADME